MHRLPLQPCKEQVIARTIFARRVKLVIMCIQNLLSNTETWAKPTSTFSPLKENMLKKEKILPRFFFFPLQKLTSIFYTETHMSSPLARGSRPSSKNAFFLREEKLPEKIFIMKTR